MNATKEIKGGVQMRVFDMMALLEELAETANSATYRIIKAFLYKYVAATSWLGFTLPTRVFMKKQRSCTNKHKIRYVVEVRLFHFWRRQIMVTEFVGG